MQLPKGSADTLATPATAACTAQQRCQMRIDEPANLPALQQHHSILVYRYTWGTDLLHVEQDCAATSATSMQLASAKIALTQLPRRVGMCAQTADAYTAQECASKHTSRSTVVVIMPGSQ